MVESMWWGLVYNSVGFGGMLNCKFAAMRRDRDEISELLSDFEQINTNWFMIPFNKLMCLQ